MNCRKNIKICRVFRVNKVCFYLKDYVILILLEKTIEGLEVFLKEEKAENNEKEKKYMQKLNFL